MTLIKSFSLWNSSCLWKLKIIPNAIGLRSWKYGNLWGEGEKGGKIAGISSSLRWRYKIFYCSSSGKFVQSGYICLAFPVPTFHPRQCTKENSNFVKSFIAFQKSDLNDISTQNMEFTSSPWHALWPSCSVFRGFCWWSRVRFQENGNLLNQNCDVIWIEKIETNWNWKLVLSFSLSVTFVPCLLN